MNVKRYKMDAQGKPVEDAKGSWYLFVDYDALAARLAEAERLLKAAVTPAQSWDPIADEIDAFLRAPDSATEVKS
jgi:hypothetical protein